MITAMSDKDAAKKLVPVKLVSIGDVGGRAREIHELIAQRAYAIYEGHGHLDGHDKQDWAQAESEVLATLFVGFMELNGDLRVDIGINKSELPQLRVSIEPWRLILSGNRKMHGSPMAEDRRGERSVEIFQTVDLPVEVDRPGATATFSNGLLEITIPKAGGHSKSLAARAA